MVQHLDEVLDGEALEPEGDGGDAGVSNLGQGRLTARIGLRIGAFVLALVPGDRRADERAVGTATGAGSVRVAKADEVVRATGFEPGGVAPFPQREVSQTLIDSSFFGHSVVWIGAGTPHHMASLPPTELARLAGARTFDLGATG